MRNIKAYNKKYYKEKRLSILKQKKEKRMELRNKIFNLLGHICSKCGFSDKRALQIDHINGGGCKEYKNHHDLKFYKKVIKTENKEYQILCANCNWIKREEKGEILKYAIN